jgi:predicted lipid-binding transport protein (Tim44 family)
LAARLALRRAGGNGFATMGSRHPESFARATAFREIDSFAPLAWLSDCKGCLSRFTLHALGRLPAAGNGIMDVTIQIVILAMIAAFLGLRLYSVLGRRAEHEEEPIRGRFEDKGGLPTPSASRTSGALVQPDARTDAGLALPAVERGLREIAMADRGFDAQAFVEGARGAYRMILEAYWRGDKDELSQLCDRDVFDGFSSAIDARLAAGETLDNRLIRIEEATITAASYQAPLARVTVRFTSDIAAVTRDAQGNVIAGSLNDAVESHDIWTFARNTNSPDPDWLLDETDEA